MKIPKTRILLVERHDDTVEMIRLYLGQADYHVMAASTCGECLRLARTEQFNLYLPGDGCEDGATFELRRKIRALDSGTPIVFYSAYAYPADRERGMSAGAQAYLTKPCELDELGQTIKCLIAEAPAQGVGASAD
jgi:DNA-binding response OmpR family regulator